MTRLAAGLLALACALSPLSCCALGRGGDAAEPAPAPGAASAGSADVARAGFARLAALQGDWVGEGPADVPGAMTVSYRLTGGGSALVETLFPGTPEEMVTVYAVEDGQLVLTHYCKLGNQPRMRAGPMHGNVLEFHFIGGANIDPARDQHMHDARFEFVSNEELITQWTGWNGGQPDAALAPRLHFTRKG